MMTFPGPEYEGRPFHIDIHIQIFNGDFGNPEQIRKLRRTGEKKGFQFETISYCW